MISKSPLAAVPNADWNVKLWFGFFSFDWDNYLEFVAAGDGVITPAKPLNAQRASHSPVKAGPDRTGFTPLAFPRC